VSDMVPVIMPPVAVPVAALVPLMVVAVRLVTIAAADHGAGASGPGAGALGARRAFAPPRHRGQGQRQTQGADRAEQSVTRSRGGQDPGESVEFARFQRRPPEANGQTTTIN
jgi:hypothetical protein